MGADAWIAFYGLKFDVPCDEESLAAVEEDRDPRCRAARAARLATYMGRLTDGAPHFLFIGTDLGTFGIEGASEKSFTDEALLRIANETKAKLRDAGFEGEP
jgi:hypothetical protein